MKVLWLCNIMLPFIAEKVGLPYSNKEGWLSGTYDRIKKEGREDLALCICFPVDKKQKALLPNNGRFVIDETVCYGFVEDGNTPERWDNALLGEMESILADFKPDVVHIFGTEFPHAYAMAKVWGKRTKTLVGIQGLCYVCADYYMADLPDQIQNRVTFRDWVKKDSLKKQKEKFKIRGEREKALLELVGHVAGRTHFDEKYTREIHGGKAKYQFLNETMRAPFYTGQWKPEKCIPHSIFLSQGDYPLKGFHYVLMAMPIILARYPDACLYVAGNGITQYQSWKDKIKISSYGKYLRQLITTNRLEEKVQMLGRLNGEEMKEWYLKTSLFLCPSAIENSPNSLCEAMLLGQPTVAANVGGISSLVEGEKEGILYEAGNIKKLAASVLRMWDDQQLAIDLGKAGRKKALVTHDAEVNYKRLLSIYEEIAGGDV